jgi:hypothetical protein
MSVRTGPSASTALRSGATWFVSIYAASVPEADRAARMRRVAIQTDPMVKAGKEGAFKATVEFFKKHL